LIIKEQVESNLLDKFPEKVTKNPGFRSVFVLNVERISSSCGYSLPVMTYQKTRTTLDEFAERKGVEGMKDYCLYNNSFSIDGLPSLAQLRNPDVTIVPKPEDGYIHGEAVASGKSSSRSSSKLISFDARSKTGGFTLNSMISGIVLFVGGVLFGCFAFPPFLEQQHVGYYGNGTEL